MRHSGITLSAYFARVVLGSNTMQAQSGSSASLARSATTMLVLPVPCEPRMPIPYFLSSAAIRTQPCSSSSTPCSRVVRSMQDGAGARGRFEREIRRFFWCGVGNCHRPAISLEEYTHRSQDTAIFGRASGRRRR